MVIRVGTNSNDVLNGGLFDSIDFLSGGNGNDIINGGGGNDELFGDAGNDRLFGGPGNDLLNGGTGNDLMAGGAGNDRYVVDALDDVVDERAGEGTDTIVSFIENYSLLTNVNVENLILDGNALRGFGNALNNQITGNSQDNLLRGDAGNDTLNGGAGNDILIGQSGNDTLTGGAGQDSFRYTLTEISTGGGSGVDVITDFVSGTDKILITGFASGIPSLAPLTIVETDDAAALSEAQLIYSKASGSVFFNQNQGAAGFGTGGQFVIVQGSVLTSSDISGLPGASAPVR